MTERTLNRCACGNKMEDWMRVCRTCLRKYSKPDYQPTPDKFMVTVVRCPDNSYPRGYKLRKSEFRSGRSAAYIASSLHLGYCFPHGMVIEKDGVEYMVVGNEDVPPMTPEDSELWQPQRLERVR